MELARTFAVSRPSIREALGALQFAGHVDSVRGSGTRVVSVRGTLDHVGATVPELTALAALNLAPARIANLMDCSANTVFYMLPWHNAVIIWYATLVTTAAQYELPLPSIAAGFLNPYA